MLTSVDINPVELYVARVEVSTAALRTFFFICGLLLLLFFCFGCPGSSLLHADFPLAAVSGATRGCSVQGSHCSGFLLQSTGSRLRSLVVAACRLSSSGALECTDFSSFGVQAQ